MLKMLKNVKFILANYVVWSNAIKYNEIYINTQVILIHLIKKKDKIYVNTVERQYFCSNRNMDS